MNRELPKHVETFVDAMGGAFNVGANIVATDKVIYNEINTYVYDLISWILNTSKSNQIKSTQKIIGEYGLSKKNKEAYLALRNDFNANYEVQKLFVLHLYSFQNMIRFNSKLKFNTPVGVAGYSDDLKNRQLNFIPKTENIELINGSYANLKISKMNKNTVFYFDPPYNITKS
ncbi:DNA adenine methylase [Limosilactobacillus fermentum]